MVASPIAAGRIWMVSDGVDVSTPDLIRLIASIMGRRAFLVPVPVPLLRALGVAVGREAEVMRLYSSLTVDITSTRRQLNWAPPVSLDEGIRRTVHWYTSKGRSLVA